MTIKEKEINILLQANYHKGVSEGMITAVQMIRANAEEIERTQDSAEGEDGNNND